MSIEDGILDSVRDYQVITRTEINLRTVSPLILLAINQNARHAIEVALVRLQVSEAEILRRHAEGESMENDDFDYKILPDADSPTETKVITTWKPDKMFALERES